MLILLTPLWLGSINNYQMWEEFNDWQQCGNFCMSVLHTICNIVVKDNMSFCGKKERGSTKQKETLDLDWFSPWKFLNNHDINRAETLPIEWKRNKESQENFNGDYSSLVYKINNEKSKVPSLSTKNNSMKNYVTTIDIFRAKNLGSMKRAISKLLNLRYSLL